MLSMLRVRTLRFSSRMYLLRSQSSSSALPLICTYYLQFHIYVGFSSFEPLVFENSRLIHIITDDNVSLSGMDTLNSSNLLRNLTLCPSGKYKVESVEAWDIKALVCQLSSK